jgi:NAD+ synthase (glutamine-hydrolysing)
MHGAKTDQLAGCSKKNIELIMNPSASHFALGKSALRQRLVIDSSRKFSCYYVYANLLGNEAGRMLYDGEIMMAGHGQMLQMNRKLSFEDVNLLAVEIDTEDKQPSTTIGTLPAEDRFEIFARAESLALFDYLRKSRSKGFVLSLSGGADSSTCALLVAEMVRRSLGELGLKKVLKKIAHRRFYRRLPAAFYWPATQNDRSKTASLRLPGNKKLLRQDTV